MPYWNCKFIFDAPGGQGWTEKFLLLYESQSALRAKLQELAQLRAKALAQEITFEAYQYSEIDWRGDGFAESLPNGYTKSGLPGEPVNVGALFRIYESNRYWRNEIFGGLPDDWVVYDSTRGLYILTQPGYSVVQPYVSALIAAPSYFQSTTKIDDAGLKVRLIAAVSVPGDPYSIQVTFSDDFSEATLNTVLKFTNGRKTASGFNGTWRVTAVNTPGATVTVPIEYRDIQGYTDADLLKVTVYTAETQLNKMNFFTYTKVATHKRGKSPFAPRGRR